MDEITSILTNLVTKDDMDRKIAKLGDEIRKENRDLVDKMKKRISALEDENKELRGAINSLEEQVSEHGDMESRLNDLEQQGRKNSIRIFGLRDTSTKETAEECVTEIVNFVNNNLNVTLREVDIDIAHRLGKFDKDRPRNVIVKFTHRRKKHEIIRARKELKGTGYTIFEDLTKHNQLILKDAYKLSSVKNTFSVDGKLFAVLQNGKKGDFRMIQF